MAKRKNFGEMQFTFAVLHELTNKLRSRGFTPPFVPTQHDENNCGYDARMKSKYVTMFIQFKKSEHKTKSSADNWKYYSRDFYQFKLRPLTKSKQHNILVDMANKNPKFRVFYCAPGFTTNKEYYEYFCRSEILRNSIFVPVKRLGLITDNDNHAVTFLTNPMRDVQMHSETKIIDTINDEILINQLLEAERFESLEECVTKLSQDLEIEVNKNDTLEEQLADIHTQVLKEYKTHLCVYKVPEGIK